MKNKYKTASKLLPCDCFNVSDAEGIKKFTGNS